MKVYVKREQIIMGNEIGEIEIDDPDEWKFIRPILILSLEKHLKHTKESIQEYVHRMDMMDETLDLNDELIVEEDIKRQRKLEGMIKALDYKSRLVWK